MKVSDAVANQRNVVEVLDGHLVYVIIANWNLDGGCCSSG